MINIRMTFILVALNESATLSADKACIKQNSFALVKKKVIFGDSTPQI